MSNKTKDSAAEQIKAIKEQYGQDIIKDYMIPSLCDTKTAADVGYAVVLHLNGKFEYTLALLEEWREKFLADEVTIKVERCVFKVTYKVYYNKKGLGV